MYAGCNEELNSTLVTENQIQLKAAYCTNVEELEPSYNQLAEQQKRLPLHDEYIYIILLLCNYLVLCKTVILAYF